MIIAQHLGTSGLSPATKKSTLVNTAQKALTGYDFKPTMVPKQKFLNSNFAELTGSTSFIDTYDPNLAKTLLEV